MDWPRWPRQCLPPSCRYQRLRLNSPARRPRRPLVPRLLDLLRRRAHRPARSDVSSGAQPAPSGVRNGARAEPIAVSPAARAEKRGVSSGGRPELHNERRKRASPPAIPSRRPRPAASAPTSPPPARITHAPRCGQRRQAIVFTTCPPKFDRHVLAFDKSAVVQAPPKPVDDVPERFGR